MSQDKKDGAASKIEKGDNMRMVVVPDEFYNPIRVDKYLEFNRKEIYQDV